MHHPQVRPGIDIESRDVDFIAATRRAVLATIDADGRPRLVPICFAVGDDGPLVVYSPLDDKPKTAGDPLDLARVRDLVADPRVSLLVDRWSEEWSELGWIRLDGRATVLSPADPAAATERAMAVHRLRMKYPQYATHRLEERPMIRIAVERVRSWGRTRD